MVTQTHRLTNSITEDCRNDEKDSIGLKSFSNNSSAKGSRSNIDDCKESFDNKAMVDAPVEVTKDSDPINKVTSVSAVPAGLINPPIPGPAEPGVVLSTIVNNSESEKRKIYQSEKREILGLELNKTQMDKSLGRR